MGNQGVCLCSPACLFVSGSHLKPEVHYSVRWEGSLSNCFCFHVLAIVLVHVHVQVQNSNNRLFMAPWFTGAQREYAHFITHTFMHTHPPPPPPPPPPPTHTHTHTTNTCITGDGLVEWEERKQQMGFQFWLKRRKWGQTHDTWQREEESSRSQVQCIERNSPTAVVIHALPWTVFIQKQKQMVGWLVFEFLLLIAFMPDFGWASLSWQVWMKGHPGRKKTKQKTKAIWEEQKTKQKLKANKSLY